MMRDDIHAGDIMLTDTGMSLNLKSGRVRPAVVAEVTEDKDLPILYVLLPLVRASLISPLRSYYLGMRYGLRRRSAVILDTPVLITDTRAFRRRIGKVTGAGDMRRIEKGYRTFNDKKDTGYILSLCPKCLHDFMECRDRIIRRMDRLEKTKRRCDFCQMRSGWSYILLNKNKKN